MKGIDLKNDKLLSAKSIWDERYEKGETTCTKPIAEGDPVDYTQYPFLYQHAVSKRLTGSLDIWIMEKIGSQFLRPPADRMLALGSGMAFNEEYFLKMGYAQSVVAYEMSSVAVEAARQRLDAAGLGGRIELRCGDVADDNLPEGSFDVVYVQAALHHFFRIEEMFALIHRTLRPGGLLLYDEYVGPDHHLYEPEVMAILDEINDCLASQYRWDVVRKETRTSIPRATMDSMLQMDPSEGVHASRILPLTYKWFDVVHRSDYGGAVMRPFFVGILPDFDFTNPRDQTVARLIILIEELLTRYGIIPNYHTIVVGKRRETPRNLTVEEEARINYSDWPGLGSAFSGSFNQIPRAHRAPEHLSRGLGLPFSGSSKQSMLRSLLAFWRKAIRKLSR